MIFYKYQFETCVLVSGKKLSFFLFLAAFLILWIHFKRIKLRSKTKSTRPHANPQLQIVKSVTTFLLGMNFELKKKVYIIIICIFFSLSIFELEILVYWDSTSVHVQCVKHVYLYAGEKEWEFFSFILVAFVIFETYYKEESR